MTMAVELALGTAMLVACSVCQAGAVVAGARLLTRISRQGDGAPSLRRAVVLLVAGLLVMIAGHTIQVWGWATALILLGAFGEFEPSLYFATVTYTTLGYGDITVDPGIRVFVTFASISGLVAFGITSAFLVALIMRILPLLTAND